MMCVRYAVIGKGRVVAIAASATLVATKKDTSEEIIGCRQQIDLMYSNTDI